MDVHDGPVVSVHDGTTAVGVRYEMWCLARAAATRSCVFHVVTDPQQCRSWNGQRSADGAYEAAVLDDLLSRFERPDSRSRWDAPLIE